jgi:hypothetical protein
MDNSLKNKSVCVWDYGNNVSLAKRLTREFGQVRYFSPWQSTAPETVNLVVGDGLKDVERVKNFFDPDVLHGTDLFIFPDCYCGDLQRDLISRGKRVFGSGMSEGYEFKRELFAKTLAEIGLDVAPYTVVIGTTALRKHLEENENLWIKVSMRGDGETWCHENYTLSKRKLEALEYMYGPVKEFVRFTCCESIPTSIETAYDGFMITSPDGKPQFPTTGFLGYETKNLAHILTAIPYKMFPDAVLDVNKKFAPKLAEKFYRCNFGTEIKIGDDGKNYFLDATLRAPEPPGSIVLEQVQNLGEFMFHGADGKLIELEIEKQFGVQVMLYSGWARSNWQTVEVPEVIDRWVKLYRCCYADGAYQVVPKEVKNPYSDGHEQIGAVVALGDTIAEAIEQVREHCDQVKGFDVTNQIEALAECLARIQAGEKENIQFADEVPEPVTALENAG